MGSRRRRGFRRRHRCGRRRRRRRRCCWSSGRRGGARQACSRSSCHSAQQHRRAALSVRQPRRAVAPEWARTAQTHPGQRLEVPLRAREAGRGPNLGHKPADRTRSALHQLQYGGAGAIVSEAPNRRPTSHNTRRRRRLCCCHCCLLRCRLLCDNTAPGSHAGRRRRGHFPIARAEAPRLAGLAADGRRRRGGVATRLAQRAVRRAAILPRKLPHGTARAPHCGGVRVAAGATRAITPP